MKIYFAGSIRGGRQDAELYLRIIKQLQAYGTVLTEHVGAKTLEESGEKHMTEKEIHDRDMTWLNDCDVLVAEVTQPSLGVGYEIGRAITLNKRILCMFRPDSGKSLSAMIAGAVNGSSSFVVKNYKEEDVQSILKAFLN
ncbi:2'-deoxynucleoside 5'-phosphate N-hydrolase 1-like isoform X2 [Mizuhopecten yessoensis]|uniref:2'-deoxynucleoside 5'-phosphate N-hydrolase 1-like isoform X2 n=1 Tax=Mizuhopecten yessoensis TaxID=6573 RepID=UPI000B45B6C9|nr:2'-deoxynucleoside 5'-phosphate N-hydrolase 1-like isoform X2 [Mizuhopecten yessoensis]